MQLFFRGVPPEGEEGRKKNSRENSSGPQNLKFPLVYPTRLGLEGARRVFFKVTMDISA